MEGGCFMVAPGHFKEGLLLPVPQGLNLQPAWRAIAGRARFCSYRRASGLRIGRSYGGARQMLPSVFGCLESLDSDNELRNHSSDHFDVREARLEHELKGAAWLRAEAYSEEQTYTRYVDSFKKKFAEQEFAALKRRVSSQPGSYICLVAVIVSQPFLDVSKVLPKDAGDLAWQTDEKETPRVLGTLDLSLHHPSPGEAFGGKGLPYGYIANVCVDKSSRKQGIASTLMEHAVQVGRNWGLNAIYVHTHATNNPAYKLYLKKGFEVLQSGSPPQLLDGNLLLRLQM